MTARLRILIPMTAHVIAVVLILEAITQSRKNRSVSALR
jgi:hypothetical protein